MAARDQVLLDRLAVEGNFFREIGAIRTKPQPVCEPSKETHGSLLRVREHETDRIHDAFELFSFGSEVFVSGCRNRVVPCAPVVLRCTPYRLDAAVEEQALEGRIERALPNL